MASPAEFDVWNACGAIPFNKPVAEETVEFSDLFMMDMIEEDRLVQGHPAENRKDGVEKGFGLKTITVVGNDGE